MRSPISIKGCVRPSYTSWNHAKVPFLTKTTTSTSENASYAVCPALFSNTPKVCLVALHGRHETLTRSLVQPRQKGLRHTCPKHTPASKASSLWKGENFTLSFPELERTRAFWAFMPWLSNFSCREDGFGGDILHPFARSKTALVTTLYEYVCMFWFQFSGKGGAQARHEGAVIIFENVEAEVRTMSKLRFYLEFHSACLEYAVKSKANKQVGGKVF